MALQILSDLDQWNKVANIDNGDGTYTTRLEAMAYVVYGSMSVGLDVLDEKTAPEYLARLKAWEVIDGPALRRHDPDTDDYVPVPVTMDALRPFFGTRTNAFPALTRNKFNKIIAEALMNRVERRIKRGE